MDQHAIDRYDDIETRLEREAEKEGWGDLQRRAVIAAERQAAALERIAAVLERVEKPNGDHSLNVFIMDIAKDTADYLREGSWLR